MSVGDRRGVLACWRRKTGISFAFAIAVGWTRIARPGFSDDRRGTMKGNIGNRCISTDASRESAWSRISVRKRRATLRAMGLAALGAAAAGPVASAQSTWNGGAGNWADPSKWTGGVPNSPTVDVFIDGGNAVNSVVTL